MKNPFDKSIYPVIIVFVIVIIASLVLRPLESKTEKTKEPEVSLGCQKNENFEGFRSVLFRSGNRLETYLKLESWKICFAESDFLMNSEGVLVSAHDDKLIGKNCGSVSKSSIKELQDCILKGGYHIATLSDFLDQPLTEWFIDLKDTLSGDDEKVFDSVSSAIKEIRRKGLQNRAVIMIYRAPDNVVELIHHNEIRAGFKGYPQDASGVKNLVLRSKQKKFELVSVRLSSLDTEIINFSSKLGVWILPWDLGLISPMWSEFAKAGIGGIITRHVKLTQEVVEPLWEKP